MLDWLNILKIFFNMCGVAEVEVSIVILFTEGSLHNLQLSDAVISKLQYTKTS